MSVQYVATYSYLKDEPFSSLGVDRGPFAENNVYFGNLSPVLDNPKASSPENSFSGVIFQVSEFNSTNSLRFSFSRNHILGYALAFQ